MVDDCNLRALGNLHRRYDGPLPIGAGLSRDESDRRLAARIRHLHRHARTSLLCARHARDPQTPVVRDGQRSGQCSGHRNRACAHLADAAISRRRIDALRTARAALLAGR